MMMNTNIYFLTLKTIINLLFNCSIIQNVNERVGKIKRRLKIMRKH